MFPFEYTILSIFSVLAVAVLDLKIAKTRLIQSKKFWLFILISFLLHTIVDNYLNGRWGLGSFIVGPYNREFYLGIKIFFTPLENYLFGFSLLTLNVILFEKFSN